jgi:hypothetical protein
LRDQRARARTHFDLGANCKRVAAAASAVLVETPGKQDAVREDNMAKHIISAQHYGSVLPTRYFLGYSGDLLQSLPRWTMDWHRARWFDADEVEAEVALLAADWPDQIIRAEPLNARIGDVPTRRSPR